MQSKQVITLLQSIYPDRLDIEAMVSGLVGEATGWRRELGDRNNKGHKQTISSSGNLTDQNQVSDNRATNQAGESNLQPDLTDINNQSNPPTVTQVQYQPNSHFPPPIDLTTILTLILTQLPHLSLDKISSLCDQQETIAVERIQPGEEQIMWDMVENSCGLGDVRKLNDLEVEEKIRSYQHRGGQVNNCTLYYNYRSIADIKRAKQLKKIQRLRRNRLHQQGQNIANRFNNNDDFANSRYQRRTYGYPRCGIKQFCQGMPPTPLCHSIPFDAHSNFQRLHLQQRLDAFQPLSIGRAPISSQQSFNLLQTLEKAPQQNSSRHLPSVTDMLDFSAVGCQGGEFNDQEETGKGLCTSVFEESEPVAGGTSTNGQEDKQTEWRPFMMAV